MSNFKLHTVQVMSRNASHTEGYFLKALKERVLNWDKLENLESRYASSNLGDQFIADIRQFVVLPRFLFHRFLQRRNLHDQSDQI